MIRMLEFVRNSLVFLTAKFAQIFEKIVNKLIEAVMAIPSCKKMSSLSPKINSGAPGQNNVDREELKKETKVLL